MTRDEALDRLRGEIKKADYSYNLSKGKFDTTDVEIYKSTLEAILEILERPLEELNTDKAENKLDAWYQGSQRGHRSELQEIQSQLFTALGATE